MADQTVETEDAALMRQMAAGSEAAFRLLAARYLPRMLRLATKTLGQPADAEDVAQEALVRLWRHAGDWQPQRASLSTWLYTIVYRLSIDRLRRRPGTGMGVALDQALDVADPQPGAFDVVARDDEMRALASAMGRLGARQRAALTLFYYEELSGQAAAEVLGMGLSAFWSLLHRARCDLRDGLHGERP